MSGEKEIKMRAKLLNIFFSGNGNQGQLGVAPTKFVGSLYRGKIKWKIKTFHIGLFTCHSR